MIEVQSLEQLNIAIKTLRSGYSRGLGTMELLRSLGIDPRTELRGGDWRGTNFAGCDLRGADLSMCRLSFCDFTDADVAGAVFYGSDLHKSTLHRAANVDRAYLSNDQKRYLDRWNDNDSKSETDEGWVFQINQKIHAAHSFYAAKTQFDSILARGLQPDKYSAGLLLRSATSATQAWDAFGLVERAKCPLNDVVFTTLASKMDEVADIRSVIEIMRSRGFAPGVRIFNSILARTKVAPEMDGVLAEMQREGVSPDNVTYNIQMRRVSFDGRKRLMLQLVEAGLHPRTMELNILLQGARSEDQADEAIEIANELEIGRDIETYALIAPFKARSSAFRALIDDMLEDELRRDADFYALALARAKTFSDACFLYGRMKGDAVPAIARIYDRLAELAGIPRADYDDGRSAWPEEAIAALIRRVGTAGDMSAAGLSKG